MERLRSQRQRPPAHYPSLPRPVTLRLYGYCNQHLHRHPGRNTVLMLTGELRMWFCTERAEWLRGGLVSVNWDYEEMEEHKEEILQKGLIRLAFTGANFGKGRHPWEANA